MALRSLFLDFDSYFAAVEQQERPELRDRPVIVIPVKAETTSCIAVSREAKKLGIRRGMRVSEARRFGPRLAVVLARPPVYLDYHHRLIAAVDACAPVVKVHSIDEMACALPRGRDTRERATALGLEVKASIAARVGEHLSCSIGVAPNSFLAKAACSMQKPDGLVVIESHELPDAITRLELGVLRGIGSRMLERLHRAGIATTGELFRLSRPQMRKLWGSVEGERIHDLLHGGEAESLPSRRSVISHAHVLAPEQRDDDTALAVLHRLLQKAATRLRRSGHFARGMSVSVEYSRRMEGFCAEIAFRETRDTLELTAALRLLWDRRPRGSRSPRHVCVSLTHLLPEESRTPSLFRDDTELRRDRLSKAMDSLNARYGKNTVYLGSAHAALDSAPMRIAFNFIPEPGD